MSSDFSPHTNSAGERSHSTSSDLPPHVNKPRKGQTLEHFLSSLLLISHLASSLRSWVIVGIFFAKGVTRQEKKARSPDGRKKQNNIRREGTGTSTKRQRDKRQKRRPRSSLFSPNYPARARTRLCLFKVKGYVYPLFPACSLCTASFSSILSFVVLLLALATSLSAQGVFLLSDLSRSLSLAVCGSIPISSFAWPSPPPPVTASHAWAEKQSKKERETEIHPSKDCFLGKLTPPRTEYMLCSSAIWISLLTLLAIVRIDTDELDLLYPFIPSSTSTRSSSSSSPYSFLLLAILLFFFFFLLFLCLSLLGSSGVAPRFLVQVPSTRPPHRSIKMLDSPTYISFLSCLFFSVLISFLYADNPSETINLTLPN
ncbi:uncharacterized protein ARB_04481 [Trichophyton benhamiae CBS 112371]|uniref:Uncharacterized protein n=1 Tax=Arthroderma benhamiae (strain ATCC MYA-4681 / CBS 112371) TaxID=663331 RepID=D4AJN1_ARTBC|nr:uncharacterized protein ARB_04481 [Trichophyton benhamiae CBS 112371]EFE36954.1 hypothetical protein ARB_04481 [Trichophyton benhamiae CBS 112371]